MRRHLSLLLLILILGCGGTYSDVQHYIKMEDYRTAKRQLESYRSKDAKGWTLLAECSYHEEDYPGLIEASKKSLQISDEFRQRLEYLLQRTYIELLNKAVIAFQSQDNQTASLLFDYILAIGAALDPEVNPQIKSLEDDILMLAGATALRMKDFKRARGYYERVKSIRGTDPTVSERLALTYFYLGERNLCLEACDDVLQQKPGNLNALKWRAQVIDEIGTEEDALNAYRDVLDFNYTERTLHLNIGVILFQLEDWRRARQHFENAYRADSRKSLDLLILIAECLYNEGRYSQALEKFEQVEKIRPHDSDVKRYIGACYWNLDRPDSAKDAFSQAKQTAAPIVKDSSTLPADSTQTGTKPEGGGEEQ